jgi:hypothetical protein
VVSGREAVLYVRPRLSEKPLHVLTLHSQERCSTVDQPAWISNADYKTVSPETQLVMSKLLRGEC